MVDTRETRASACEIKFLIDEALAPRVRAWARTHLQPDPHGTGSFGDEYRTSTLYFDTEDFDVFYRRRSFARAKYRVRRYGDSERIFLERKLRKPGMLIKRRTVATIASLTRLTEPGADSGWPGHWFHRRLLVRRLRPVCQVGYHRMARVTASSEGLARLTLDANLHAAPIDAPRFTPGQGAGVLDRRQVLELKYHARVPAIFRRLIEEFALAPETASKYRLGMSAVAHVSASDAARDESGDAALHA